MDYEFGIENQQPFFRKKSNIKYLTNDLLITNDDISDIGNTPNINYESWIDNF